MTSAIAVAAARRHAKPVVVTQNIGFIEYRFPLLNWIERAAYVALGRRVLRAASHLVLATPTATRYVTQLLGGLPPESSEFPIGIDTVRFRPATIEDRHAARERLSLESNRPVVLFAGRLVEKKGVPMVLQTARALPEAIVLLAGDGPLRGLLQTAPPNVVWLREVGAGEMTTCYHAADLVLLPSVGEGLPLVVQEAMASGLPTVISEDEIYAQNLRDVCVTAPRSAPALAEAIRRALGPERETLGRIARTYAIEHWSVDVMVERYHALVARLLTQQQSHGATD